MFAIHHEPTLADSIASFSASVEGMADLRLVRAVDETVDALCAEAKLYRNMAVLGRAITARIASLPVEPGVYVDAEGTLEAGLDEVANRFESLLSTLTAKKGAVDQDARLHAAHCDMLHSAYDDALVALATLIEVTKDMRAATIRHDLAAESRNVPVHESVQSLKAAILAQ